MDSAHRMVELWLLFLSPPLSIFGLTFCAIVIFRCLFLMLLFIFWTTASMLMFVSSVLMVSFFALFCFVLFYSIQIDFITVPVHYILMIWKTEKSQTHKKNNCRKLRARENSNLSLSHLEFSTCHIISDDKIGSETIILFDKLLFPVSFSTLHTFTFVMSFAFSASVPFFSSSTLPFQHHLCYVCITVFFTFGVLVFARFCFMLKLRTRVCVCLYGCTSQPS